MTGVVHSRSPVCPELGQQVRAWCTTSRTYRWVLELAYMRFTQTAHEGCPKLTKVEVHPPGRPKCLTEISLQNPVKSQRESDV